MNNNCIYGLMNVNDLKRELRSRRAKVTGTKEILIERLRDYDRNNNFKPCSSDKLQYDLQYSVEWPEEKSYRSVDSKIVIPNFDIVNINTYFLELYKDNVGMSEYSAVHRKGYNMLQNGYLLALIVSDTVQHIFFKGQVHSENTKSLTYFASLALCRESGCIEQSVCECVAGKGPKAICKHMSVLCYAILRYKELNTWCIRQTPTQKKQVWHAPKKMKVDVSPKKAENLSYDILEYNVLKRNKKNMCYDPRPELMSSSCEVEKWSDSVKNNIINYCCLSKKRLGICGILESACMQDIVHDHDYLSMPLHHQFIFNSICVTADLAKQIENKTKTQSKSKLWHLERSFRVTASNVGEICKFTEKRDKVKYAQTLVSNKKIINPALEWGKSKESTAIEAYEAKSHKKVERCGLFISVEYPFIGATPDGLIEQDKILEVKCPFSIKDECIAPENYPHLNYTSKGLHLKESSNYYYQIQTQMLVTGRTSCELFVWTNVDEKIISVNRNDTLIENIIIPRVEAFYFEFMLPVISKQRYDC